MSERNYQLLQIRDLLSGMTGAPANRINGETRLSPDCAISGDNADEFMQAFAKTFSLDLTPFDFLPTLDQRLVLIPFYVLKRDRLIQDSICGNLGEGTSLGSKRGQKDCLQVI